MNQPINPSPYNEVVDAKAPDGVTLSCEIPNTDDTIDSTVFVLYNETDKTAISYIEDKSKRKLNELGNLCVSTDIGRTTNWLINGKDFSWRNVSWKGLPEKYISKIESARIHKDTVTFSNSNIKNLRTNIYASPVYFENDEGLEMAKLYFDDTTQINDIVTEGCYIKTFNYGITESVVEGTVISANIVKGVPGTFYRPDTSALEVTIEVKKRGTRPNMDIGYFIVYPADCSIVSPGDFVVLNDTQKYVAYVTEMNFINTNIQLKLSCPFPNGINNVLIYNDIDYGESPYYYFSTADTPEFYVRNVWSATDEKNVYYNDGLNNIFDVTIGDTKLMRSLKYNIYKRNQKLDRNELIVSSPVICNKYETHWCCHDLISNTEYDSYTIEAVLTTTDGQKIVSSKDLSPLSVYSVTSITAEFFNSNDENHKQCIKLSGFESFAETVVAIDDNCGVGGNYGFNIDIFREDKTDGKIEYAGKLYVYLESFDVIQTNTKTKAEFVSRRLSQQYFYDYNIKCEHEYEYYAQPSFFDAKRYVVTNTATDDFTKKNITDIKEGDIWLFTAFDTPLDGFCYYLKNDVFIKIPSIYVSQYHIPDDTTGIIGTDFYAKSNVITPSWDSWRICSLVRDDEIDNKFYINSGMAWNMTLNFEPSALQYNNGKTYTDRFSKYPLVNKGYTGYLQGSVKFLYGDENVLCKTGEYLNPSIIRDKWIEFVDSSDYKLLSDTHGHNMIVDISNLQFEYNETIIDSPMYISFDYMQVADTKDVIITGV